MLRNLIPLPKHLWNLDAETRMRTHNRLMNQTLAEIRHEPLDAKWIRRWTAWMGHLARLPPTRLAKILAVYKNVTWWKKATSPSLMDTDTPKSSGNLSRLENPLIRYHPSHQNWIQAAQNRKEWTKQAEIFSCRARGIPEPKPPAPHQGNPPTTTPPNSNPNHRKRSLSLTQSSSPVPPDSSEAAHARAPAPKKARNTPSLNADLPWNRLIELPLATFCPQAPNGCGRRLRSIRRGNTQLGGRHTISGAAADSAANTAATAATASTTSPLDQARSESRRPHRDGRGGATSRASQGRACSNHRAESTSLEGVGKASSHAKQEASTSTASQSKTCAASSGGASFARQRRARSHSTPSFHLSSGNARHSAW